MERIKIIIAEDSDFVRDGMKIILDVDEDFEVIGCARNGREAIELAQKNAPDIFLMDIQMPEMDGIEATKYIVENNLGKVLILTTFDDDELVQGALKNGAKGYLIKNHTPEHLKQMIKSVHNGLGVMEEEILENLAKNTEPKAKGFCEDGYTAAYHLMQYIHTDFNSTTLCVFHGIRHGFISIVQNDFQVFFWNGL